MHVYDEVRQALVLGCVPIGAGEQQTPLGVMRAGRPDFLAVDDPTFTVLHCARCRARQVRTAAGFAEQLTPGVLARQNAPQKTLFVRLAAVLEQGRSGQHADPDPRDADRPDGVKFRFDEGVQRNRQSAPEPFTRPVRHTPAGIGELVAPVDQAGRRVPVLCQPATHFLTGLLFEVNTHATASSRV